MICKSEIIFVICGEGASFMMPEEINRRNKVAGIKELSAIIENLDQFFIFIFKKFLVQFKRKSVLLFILVSLSTLAVNAQGGSDYIPPDFMTPAKINEYYSADYWYNHVYSYKIRSDCKFIFEVFYPPYDSAILDRQIGKYYLSNDTLFFVYETILDSRKMEVQLPKVPWSFPDKPKYLVLHKNKIYTAGCKKNQKKAYFALRNKSEFELDNCNQLR